MIKSDSEKKNNLKITECVSKRIVSIHLSTAIVIHQGIDIHRKKTCLKITDLLDLELVNGSCPRTQDDSSPHHSVQHEGLQLASGFNSSIYQQVFYKCSFRPRVPSASVPMDRLPENHFGQCQLWMADSMPCKSQASLPYF